MEYCHYMRDGTKKGAYIFIPVCSGGAVSGPHACHCLTVGERLNLAEKRIELIAKRYGAIDDALKRFFGDDWFADGLIEKLNSIEIKRKFGNKTLKIADYEHLQIEED